ncbi:MAG: hypothetical protein ACREJX_21295, partial [Polyangiaceae bacterium]
GPAPSLGGRAFIAHDISLGDVGADGGADPNAWSTVGADIDGQDTGADSGSSCSLALGASTDVQIDGENGIDNSFAKNVLPIFASLGGSDFSASLTSSIESGGPTLMIDVQGLTDDPSQTASSLDAQLLSVVHSGARPTWDGTDSWDVYMSSLIDGAISKGARARFSASSIASCVWSNGLAGDVPLTLAFGGVSIDVVVHHATVSFRHDGAHHASGGVVAGVINTSDFLAGLQPLFKQIGACPYTYALNPEIEAASDIMDDGTNTSGVACNAISIGIGFTADEALSPNSVTGDPIPGSACP